MIKLKIDHKEVTAQEGTVLMEVIRRQGIEVPSMCYLEGVDHFTSCMVCVVKDSKNGKIIPSCSLKAEDGMEIVSMDEEIREARRTALELLLSEHTGDCEAPCQITCPAHMDIPLMNRLLAEGRFREALEVVKRDIALPSVFGRICPAPCEGACRRKPVDGAVSICLLKRYAGDHDAGENEPWIPGRAPETGKRVTVIGAGAAGLAAAYHLSLRGHAVTVVDRNRLAGGSLRKEVKPEQLPPQVLDREIGLLVLSGVTFELGTEVDAGSFREIAEKSDATVVATGKGESGAGEWGLPMHAKGIEADNRTYRVGDTPVFATGSALKPSRMAIRALGQGKEAAFGVDQFLRGEPVRGEPFLFNSRFGKLVPSEVTEYMKETVERSRIEPADLSAGFTMEQVKEEAARCMRCDCRDLHTCRLRIYSDRYEADQRRFKSEERALCRKLDQHEVVIYEPSKCIKCGICVRITEKKKEKLGLTFIGRGFEVEVGIPFSEPLGEALKETALEVAEHCPTGAISRKSP